MPLNWARRFYGECLYLSSRINCWLRLWTGLSTRSLAPQPCPAGDPSLMDFSKLETIRNMQVSEDAAPYALIFTSLPAPHPHCAMVICFTLIRDLRFTWYVLYANTWYVLYAQSCTTLRKVQPPSWQIPPEAWRGAVVWGRTKSWLGLRWPSIFNRCLLPWDMNCCGSSWDIFNYQ